MKRADKSGSKIQVLLNAGDGSQMPVQISIRPLAKNGFNHVPIGLVVTDMTAARRSEEMLRDLTHRVVQVQEAERGRVALELHDTITQMLCAVLVRSQTLGDKLPARNKPAKREAIKLHEIIARLSRKWSASRVICGPVYWTTWVWSLACTTPAQSSRIGLAYQSSWSACS